MFTNSDDFRVKKTIGSSWNVDEDDVVKTKTALKKTGDYKAPDWGVTGYPDQDMFDGLKSFQKREGLQVDGVMKPGGPTEKRLAQKTAVPPAHKAGANGTVSGNPAKRPNNQPEGRAYPDKVLGPTDWSEIKFTTGPSLPPDDTSEIGNELPGGRRRGPARKEKRTDEQQVALLQFLGPAVLASIAALRAAPPASRTAQNVLRSLPPLIGAAEEASKHPPRAGETKGDYPSPIPQPPGDKDRAKDRSNRVAIDPPPPTPGFEPPDEKLPDRTESLAKTGAGPTTEVFPNPGESKPVTLVFPADDGLDAPSILEDRRGDDETQDKLKVTVPALENELKRRGFKVKHIGGSYTSDEEPVYMPEEYVEPEGDIPAAWPDLTLEIEKDGKTYKLRLNSVTELVDGRTPEAGERRQLYKLQNLQDVRRAKRGENSILMHLPKRRGLDMKSYVRELERRIPEELDRVLGKN